MNHLTRTLSALLALTTATPDLAFGQFAPPPGGLPRLPEGGLARPPIERLARPPMERLGRPPTERPTRAPMKHLARTPIERPTRAPIGDDPQRHPVEGRGGKNSPRNISRDTLHSGEKVNVNRTFANSGGNIAGNIAARDSGNVTVNNSGDINVSGNGNGYFGRGYYGRGSFGGSFGEDVSGDYSYGRGYYRRAAYALGGYAVGVTTGAAIASSGRGSGNTYYYPSGSGSSPGSSRSSYSSSSPSVSSGGTSSRASYATSSGSTGAANAASSKGIYAGTYNQGQAESSAGARKDGSNQRDDSAPPQTVNLMMVGLFESLPPDGTVWTTEAAVAWLQAAAANLRIAYKVSGNISVAGEYPPPDSNTGYGGN